MLHQDLLKSDDINSAMLVIDNSLLTGEKIRNLTQLKQVINHFSRFYSFYRHKKDTNKYIELFVVLIKNCLAPKIYPKEQLIDKIIYTFYHYRGYDDITIEFDNIYIANLNQGWIPEENYFVKMIKDRLISYDYVLTILNMIPTLPKKLILNCSDLFSPVFGKPSYKITHHNVLTSGYGKKYIKPEFTEKDHLEFLQKYLNQDLNEFYFNIYSHISVYVIQSMSYTEIYRYIIKQFTDKNLKISNKLFLLINTKKQFTHDVIKEYIDLVDNFTEDETMAFYSSTCHSFDVIFKELLNQKKIKIIDNFELLKSLLDNKLSRTLELFDTIYCGKKTSELLYYILSKKIIDKKEIEFIKNYIINNSIEIDDALFVAFANTDMITLLEYCFENKYQLSDSIVFRMHSPNIGKQLIIANNYNYYITDVVFNHITQILYHAVKTVDDVCVLIKSVSIYKNDDDKDFIKKKEEITAYYNRLKSYQTLLTINYNDIITKEMIVTADKASVRYYLLNKYLEQQKGVNEKVDKETKDTPDTNETNGKVDGVTKPIIKKVIKKVVKKIVKVEKKNVDNLDV